MAKRSDSEFWDDEAATFDDEADHGLRDPWVRAAWGDLLRSVLPDAPATIADLGCGTGSLSLLMAEAGHHVVGLDRSENMIALAVAKASRADVSVIFRVDDAASPDLERASVDAVVVRHVTWALSDPADAVRRWTALLRSGGRLVLIEGRWSTGTGITARDLTTLVAPHVDDLQVTPLTDPALWGRPLVDERYLLAARVHGGPLS